jgi:hypothetical protein
LEERENEQEQQEEETASNDGTNERGEPKEDKLSALFFIPSFAFVFFTKPNFHQTKHQNMFMLTPFSLEHARHLFLLVLYGCLWPLLIIEESLLCMMMARPQ